jgi:hypothetical protein
MPRSAAGTGDFGCTSDLSPALLVADEAAVGPAVSSLRAPRIVLGIGRAGGDQQRRDHHREDGRCRLSHGDSPPHAFEIGATFSPADAVGVQSPRRSAFTMSTLERDDFSFARHPALDCWWSMIPRVEPEGRLFPKTGAQPGSSPGQAFSGSCSRARLQLRMMIAEASWTPARKFLASLS